jgi:CheY-like chemotaxis protein
VEAGHDVEVEADGEAVVLTINRYVMRLEHHERELQRIASRLPGVKGVTTKVGPHFDQPNIYPKIDLPTKILLVDDEKEFVEALSERLQTRNLEAAIAYDGEEALAILKDDAPEVMVLDLKMPGIDGLEVLRRVKRDHPGTEVIILTGHGSPAEAEVARELGAFAYLEKPVNVDVLAETMKAAYRKIGESR